MKYGESIFDILYLLTAIISGCVIMLKQRDSVGRLMGGAVLVLGVGDAFHLVPRVLNYFVEADLTFWLGTGKLVTSLTMTLFYVMLYLLHKKLYSGTRRSVAGVTVYTLALLRAVLCLLPQNGWFDNKSPFLWSVVRNIPFAVLGALIIQLYWQSRGEIRELSRIWLYITLSFVFYLPVAVGAGFLPVMGMLMLPKTVCYIMIIISFLRFTFRKSTRDKTL